MKKTSSLLALVICLMLLLVYLPTFSSGDDYKPMGDTLILHPDGDSEGYIEWTDPDPPYNYDEVYEEIADGYTSYISIDYEWGYDFYTLDNHTTESDTITQVKVVGVFICDTGGVYGGSVSLLIGNGTGRFPDISESESIGIGDADWFEASWTFSEDMYGNPWTWEMIDELLVGINVTAFDDATEMDCTQVYVEVEYGEEEPEYKMHFPQLPDPNGWDCDLGWSGQTADDWQCTETGDVSEIHFWISFWEDEIIEIPYFNISIWSNDPGQDFSHPDEQLWGRRSFNTENYTMTGPWFGDQGFVFRPYDYFEHNHLRYYRIDIENITDPFEQEEGTIYWLVISLPSEINSHLVGWKTSDDHFMDVALWSYGWHEPDPPAFGGVKIGDLIQEDPLDLAFVIGPMDKEPLPEYGDPTTFPDAKITNPQYPDPLGWDVKGPEVLADDWQCSETGIVTDIHFWISTYEDSLSYEEILLDFSSMNFYIYSDVPGEISHPGDILWSGGDLDYYDINLSGPYLGDEGWYLADPEYPENYTHNHVFFWRVDLTNFSNNFYQENGTIYWFGYYADNLGWKTTSSEHFMDNAVYYSDPEWYPLYDPIGSWQVYNENGGFTWSLGTSPLSAHTGNYSATCHYDIVTNDDWLVTKGTVATSNCIFSVWIDTYSYSTDEYEIYMSTSGNTVSDFTGANGTLLQGVYYPDVPTTYTFYSFDMSAYDGQTIWFAIRYLGYEYDGWYIWADDFTFPDGSFEGFENETFPPASDEPIDFAFVITGEPLEYGDPTTFPNAKMHFPQYPDPYGWDVDWLNPPDDAILADDWMCTESGNVTDIHFWLSTYGDEYGYDDIMTALTLPLGPGNFAFVITDNVPTPPSHPGNLLAVWYPDIGGYTLNLSGPYYGDEGWLVAPDAYEEHNHQQFWRVDLTNFTAPFYQENGTVYWLLITLSTVDNTIGWKTSQDHFLDNAVWGAFGAWYQLEDPLTQEPIDLAFVITGEQPLPEPSFNTTYYVNTSFNSGTPGWHITHWDNIQEAVENCTNALYNFTIVVDGDGNIYNENVLVGTAESYNTLSIIGNYTTTRPRVNGQSATKSTFELVNDEISVSGFEIHNSIGMATYHGISIGKTLALTQDQYNITIRDCYITQANYGVLLRGKYFNVSNNEIDSTTEGIYIVGPSGDSAFSTYYNNYIHDCQDGLVAYLSCNNTISRNTISSSTIYGMDLQTSSNYNTVFYNNVSSSGTSCIRIRFSANNLIYNNNFITNYPTIQGTAINFWNMSYPTCGNYYSLLAGADSYRGANQDIPGSDGVRDTSYAIATNNTDGYPFLHTFNGTYPSLGYSYIASEQPANDSEYVLVEADMSVMVGDENLEDVDVYFFWANGTLINSVNDVPSNSVASFKILDYYTMSHDTSYSWYVTFVNSTGGMTSPIWTFTTCRAYDLNGDGIINYLDVSSLVSHYGETIPQDVQEMLLRPIGDGLVTWTASPPLPVHFPLVMETIPDDPATFVWANPPVGSPELYLIGTPSYTYSIINVTLNARMCSVAGGDLFQHCIWDGFGAPSLGTPMSTVTLFPFFQTYSFTWSSDPYGGSWTWAGLSAYQFGVDQSALPPFGSPTMMTQFYLDVLYDVPGSQPWDINNDGVVNYLDVSSLVSHYGEVY